jgi:hypothetical protein
MEQRSATISWRSGPKPASSNKETVNFVPFEGPVEDLAELCEDFWRAGQRLEPVATASGIDGIIYSVFRVVKDE